MELTSQTSTLPNIVGLLARMVNQYSSYQDISLKLQQSDIKVQLSGHNSPTAQPKNKNTQIKRKQPLGVITFNSNRMSVGMEVQRQNSQRLLAGDMHREVTEEKDEGGSNVCIKQVFLKKKGPLVDQKNGQCETGEVSVVKNQKKVIGKKQIDNKSQKIRGIDSAIQRCEEALIISKTNKQKQKIEKQGIRLEMTLDPSFTRIDREAILPNYSPIDPSQNFKDYDWMKVGQSRDISLPFAPVRLELFSTNEITFHPDTPDTVNTDYTIL